MAIPRRAGLTCVEEQVVNIRITSNLRSQQTIPAIPLLAQATCQDPNGGTGKSPQNEGDVGQLQVAVFLLSQKLA